MGVHHPRAIELARQLRRGQTEAEKVLWRHVRARQLYGLKIVRQHPIDRYIVDFYCHELRLVIEVEGSIHDTPAQQARDDERFANLEAKGYRILRFSNDEVLENLGFVLNEILKTKHSCSAGAVPPPARRGSAGLPRKGEGQP
jgi:very-short-patch-repair endonuclease